MKTAARLTGLTFALILLAFAAAGALAWTPDQVTFSGEAGTGSNISYCVVDFGPASYAFKYHWDGAKNGFDMLQALQSDIQGFEFTSKPPTSQGHFVTGFTYSGSTLTGDGSVAPDYMYWGYEMSADGQAFDMSWTGSDLRDLADGSWDGWKWMSAWDWPAPTPTIPGVPEPSCAYALSSLIGLAGAAKLLLRRK